MTNEKGGRELVEKEVGKVPSRAGARPWRAARKQRYSSMVNVPSLKLSVEKRREQRAKKKALSAAVKERKEEERAAKEVRTGGFWVCYSEGGLCRETLTFMVLFGFFWLD